MQEKAIQCRGMDVILVAPTGQGKTAAILLALEEGKTYKYFLPTVVACHYMYERLKEDDISCQLYTSKRKEDYKGATNTKIIIESPDQTCIDYMMNGLDCDRLQDVDGIIMDELDTYPNRVMSILVDIVNKKRNYTQVIIASATLNKTLTDSISIYNKIIYKTDLDINKYKVEIIDISPDILDEYIYGEMITEDPSYYKDKKIGVICSSIRAAKKVHRELELWLKSRGIKDELIESEEDINSYLRILHSGLDNIDMEESERALYSEEFGIFVTNDIVSTSIDIDFDILFCAYTDKLNLIIQRWGRCNRRNLTNMNKDMYPNLYLFQGKEPFQNESNYYDVRDNLNDYLEEHDYILSYQDINELKDSVELPAVQSIDDIRKHVEEVFIDKGRPISLRGDYKTYKEYFWKDVKGVKTKAYYTYKLNTDDVVYGDFASVYDRGGDLSYLHMKDSVYKIVSKEEGIEVIEKTEEDPGKMLKEDGTFFSRGMIDNIPFKNFKNTYFDECLVSDKIVGTHNKLCNKTLDILLPNGTSVWNDPSNKVWLETKGESVRICLNWTPTLNEYLEIEKQIAKEITTSKYSGKDIYMSEDLIRNYCLLNEGKYYFTFYLDNKEKYPDIFYDCTHKYYIPAGIREDIFSYIRDKWVHCTIYEDDGNGEKRTYYL